MTLNQNSHILITQSITAGFFCGEYMRFNYVKYDNQASDVQEKFKEVCENLESMIEYSLESPRAKALALTKLEEFYMWVGKAVRDDQITRGGDATHTAERTLS